MMKIDLTGQAEVHAAFKSLVPKVQKLALARLAAAVHDDVRDRIDDHTKTGALLQSLRWVKADGEHHIYNDLQRAPHARFVHWGTRPHEIKPRLKRALRWPLPSGFAFSRKVNHPGTKPDPYFSKAAAEAPKHFARIVAQLQREI